jgi:aspartyl-tRNA(Asn)/glutamyl-tRNA(Gln) amidotransferase subunit C
LTPDQQAQAQVDLNKILGIIETLQSVDTSGIEPLAHPLASVSDIHLRLREDVITEVASAEQRAALMANAPGASEGLFLVPKVIE